MPIVDGLTSTKMIRSYEKLQTGGYLSARASRNGRVPIFAVSASLVERELQTYLNAGFDGWILKPIDFKRLNVLLLGIVDDDVRQSCLYKPGNWERGGWFHQGQKLVLGASTVPLERSPVRNLPTKDRPQYDLESHHGSESGSITPKQDGQRQPLIYDERLDKAQNAETDGLFPIVEQNPANGAASDSTT
jgi:CheY-like chemotaxis protein